MLKSTKSCLLTISAALTLFTAQLSIAEAEVTGARMAGITIEAEVTEINHATRELSLRGPMGDIITLTASDQVKRLKEISVGDIVTTTYITSLEGALREPTEEEIAEPWVVLDAAAIAGENLDPGVFAGTAIRAVCTIEGMNRLTRTVTVLDPRGRYHVIGDVEPEKMSGVTLGQTLVLIYTEAMAITLKKKDDTGAE